MKTQESVRESSLLHSSWLLKVIRPLFPIVKVILAFNNSMFKDKRVVIIKTQLNCKYLYV